MNSMLNIVSLINGVFISGYFVFSIRRLEHRFMSLLDFQYFLRSHIHLKNVFSLEKIQNITFVLCPMLSIPLFVLSEVTKVRHAQVEVNSWAIFNFAFSQFGEMLASITLLFPDILFIMIVLLFRDRANSLRSMLKSSTKQHIPAYIVVNEYIGLDRYTNKLNENFGMWILLCALGPLPFYSFNLMYLFRGEMSIRQGVISFIYFFSTAFFLLSAANISSQVKQINYIA